jgi:hypothetical protein
MPITIDWLGSWNDPESKAHIHGEISRAFGNRTGALSFEIQKTADGDGVTITIRGTPYPAPLIMASGDEWRKPRAIEGMVRRAVEGAEEGPSRVVRSMLGRTEA